MSFERLLDEAGSFRNLFAMARKGGVAVESQMQDAMRWDSELYSAVGYKVVKLEEGRAELTFPHNKRITRRGNIIHGGIIMFTLDNVCGIAVMTVNPGIDQLTTALKINFLDPMRKGPYRAVGKVVRAGTTMAVAVGEIWDADGTLSAMGMGTWLMIKKRA